MRFLLVSCLALGLLSLVAPVGAQQAPAAKPTVLFVPLRPDVQVAKHLEEAGFVWGNAERNQDLSADLLRKFNVVVLTEFPQVGTQGPTAEQTAYMDLLCGYVQQGGGLFICGGNDQDTGMCVRFQQELLKPWGASVLREFVNDPSNYFRGRAFGYAWTDQIGGAGVPPAMKSLTEGVPGLIYPMNTGWGGTSHTNPLQSDESWTVLVRAMPTAYTCALYDSKPMEDKPATYSSSPPLVAVKQVGAGRVALWPMLATCTFEDGYHWLWDDGLVLEGKRGDKASQGLRLCLNLLRWLAEPSLQSGALGGFVPEPPKPRELTAEPGFVAYDWDQARVPDGMPNVYKALIGARTALSSGKGTVAEYAAAARQAGYSYLVITEDLEKMDQAKWDQLVAQCKAATSEDLLVHPGLKFFDENGNQGVVWGDIGWPKEEWMSEKVPGRIKAIWHWTHGYHYWPPVAVITPKANPKRPWFLGKCKGFAAFTYQNGKLLEEDVAEYLEMMRLRFDNWVCAVHLLDSPQAVAEAARAGNMQTYIRANRLQDVPGHMSGTYGEPVLWYWPVFVSSGPMLRTFQALNPGTTDLATEGNDRYRLRLAASAPAGLKEVRLYDGPRLMRRFAVTGDEYDQSYDFFHDRQCCWVAEVIDQAGGRALSWGRWVEVQEQWFTNCGDNWNFMDGGKWASTRFPDTRGLEAHITRPGVDYAYPVISALRNGEPYNPLGPRPCVFVDKTMVSRFASVIDYRVDGTYEPTASPNWNDFCKREAITPLEAVSVNTRCLFFTSRPDEPQIRLIEGTIRFKQPLTLSGPTAVITAICYSGHQQPRNYDHLFHCDANGMNLCEIATPENPRERTFSAHLAAGGYVAIFPGPGGLTGAFALDDRMNHMTWMTPDTANFYVRTGEAREFPAGSVLTYRQLIVYGRRFAEPSNREMEWIRTSMGLQGPPAYTVSPTVGEVLSTQYALRVKTDGGGFRARFTRASLPEDLPVIVEGLNDRWSAGVWYVGEVPLWRPEWTVNEYGQLIAVMRERKFTDPVYFGPVQEGLGYFGVDLEKSDREVFVGNFLTCDRPEIFLHLLDLRPGKRRFEVHNAGDQAIKCTVRPAKGFTLLGDWEKAVEVPAAGSVTITLD